ncbi:hypothetical protein M885DRAFT_577606 [Pelagophyceae sp. CCMP2097]|nr:hypothetical protein M885DRAFT_577606 [Pelagophyceae sp. CCMP2097]
MDVATLSLSSNLLKAACKEHGVPCAQRTTKAIMIAALQKIYDKNALELGADRPPDEADRLLGLEDDEAAAASQGAAGTAPATVAGPERPLIRVGDLQDASEDCEVLIAERYESEGKFSVVGGKGLCKNRLRLLAGCSCRNGKCDKTTFTAHSVQEGMYICTQAEPFTCTGITESSQTLGTAAYSAPMLAAIVRVPVARDAKITGKAAGVLLASYVRRALKPAYISRDAGADAGHFQKGRYGACDLPVLKAALEMRGWKVDYVTMSLVEMQAELLRIARAAHVVRQSLQKDATKRAEFDPGIV